ncbi:unnamed protein product [Periconia digitata]|uniref:HRDC domain-containing protein n=1 Tax=Periconia digitata TaxID=1303443 RepID=A0A9W4XY21_9PLEO|nr:unnamed protein product [Periconia digitata]
MDSFKTLQDSISAALKSTTHSATRISGADLAFQRSLNPDAGDALDGQNARLLRLAQRLLENAAASPDAVGPTLSDVESIDNNWRAVVDVIDSLLEKADTSLDEYTGVVKRLSPGADLAMPAAKTRPNPARPQDKFIDKPQLSFIHKPMNNETGGFRPLMSTKPHAQVPLAECLKTFKDSHGREQYPHPYQTEIEKYEYPSTLYEQSTPIPYQPFEKTSATYVDTPEAVALMLAELKTAREIAVDLEHHDSRTYIGMVSLMQISTRDKDWIVDTLKPWRRQLECLNEVFADPNILKVLQGAYMDIIWLQRDLGLYVVGLFDTYHAARALGYPSAGLGYMLDKFVNFKAQKQHQLADWRVRPLTPELFDYARADTHFLLYIFDNIRNELVEKSNFEDPERNKVDYVLQKSKEVALQRYEHPVYDIEFGSGRSGWYNVLTRVSVQFDPQQFAVFRAVHKWRDDLGRKEDESPLFILQNHGLLSISRAMPEDKATLISTIQHVSHILRPNMDSLVSVIREAKSEGLHGPDMNVTLQRISDKRDAEREKNLQQRAQSASTPVKATPVVSKPTPLGFTAQHPPSFVAGETPRATNSQFWGSLWSNKPNEQRRSFSSQDINLALPLPPLTAEIFADNKHIEEPSPSLTKLTFIPKDERPAEDERTDIFVVKQLGGRKRKLGEAAEESAETSTLDPMVDDEIMLDEEDSDAIKRKEKAARKAAKKAKKEKERAAALDYDNEDDEVFDYANAPSVLHARDAERKTGKKDRKDKKKDASFNPYAKLADVPKGMARSQKEKSGKSKTFNS